MKTYEKMKKFRIRNGVTQKMIADKLGVSKQYIWDIENGRRELSYRMAFLISNVLGVKPDQLFFDDEKR